MKKPAVVLNGVGAARGYGYYEDDKKKKRRTKKGKSKLTFKS